jgi:acyl-CoA synthetase (AMP-forming)/AMP-acid ligase II
VGTEPLLAWLQAPRNDKGIYFAQTGERWDFWSYARLARLSARAANGLAEAGAEQNDVVSIVLPSGPEFVATFFGAMLAGATSSPLAPPSVFQDSATYAQYVGNIFATARPKIVVSDRRFLHSVAASASVAGVRRALSFDELCPEASQEACWPPPKSAELALLQFTSGSSGRGNAVRVPFGALESNVAAIRRWLRWTSDDPFASWLPLYHDMGLIGALVGATVSRSDLWLLQPEHFIHSPLRYLRCFGEFGARLTVSASFGVNYIARRIRPEALRGLDFSQWRGIVVGAERIDARALHDMYALLSPFGFNRCAFLPAYGLAEATLAVTGLPLGEGWTEAAVHPESLSVGRQVAVAPHPEVTHTPVVGCGRPLNGVEIVIVGNDGQIVPDGWVGEIVARGASVATGYLSAEGSPSSTRFTDAGLQTGDAGFVLEGQLFVCGRLGDSLKVRGRVIFGEDLEAAVWRLGVPRERVAALLGVHEGAPTAVLILEKLTHWPLSLEAVIRQHAEGAKIVFVEASRGAILRTTSGKPKRRELWRAFVEGLLPGLVITRQA